MEVLERSASSLDTAARHTEHVFSVARGQMPAAGIEEVSTSWQRSVYQHHVDPADSHAPRILTPRELTVRREPLARLLSSAQQEIDGLYKLVREAGYAILFCDTSGVVVEHRGEGLAAREFRYWGTWLGGVWSEEAEGTNGIGTCIAERRPVTVHRGQHFRSRNKDLSCSGAPIFDFDGTLLAVLDVSAIDPDLSERAHALTGVLTVSSARAIEERVFRERFHREWIVAVAPSEGGAPAMLLAVDGDQHIVGADRAARAGLMLDDAKLQAGISLWSIFERDLALFRLKDAADLPAQLIIAGSNEPCPVLLTPPEKPSRAPQGPASAALHARPRLDLLRTLSQIAPPPRARGGLPSGAMRRVREHVEVHLGETVDLAALAAVAGVSVFHFARQFKQSAGVTPHAYLIQRRIGRAREMLARTDLALSEIALLTGFADQSHFARHFRQLVGITPREFRWSLR